MLTTPSWQHGTTSCRRGARRLRSPKRFHFYLCCNSRTDATAAPADGDSLMVLCPTPPLDDDADDALVDAWIAKARAAVYERLESSAGADATPHVVHERVIAPREWRDGLGLRRGSVFGLGTGWTSWLCLGHPTLEPVERSSPSSARRRAHRRRAAPCSRRRGSSVMSERGPGR